MEISAKEIAEDQSSLRRLLACGVIGPLFFITVFLIEGATRPHYSPLRHPVSSLSYGDWGWTQRTNFVISGLLLFAFAMGLRRMPHTHGAYRSRSASRPLWGSSIFGLADCRFCVSPTVCQNAQTQMGDLFRS